MSEKERFDAIQYAYDCLEDTNYLDEIEGEEEYEPDYDIILDRCK